MKYWSVWKKDIIAIGSNCKYVTKIKRYFKKDYRGNYYHKYRKWVYAVYDNGMEELLEYYSMPYTE